MKSICICKTPFQIIVAMILALEYNQEMDLIISKEFCNADEVANKCKNIRLFHEIYTINYQEINIIKASLNPNVFINCFDKKIDNNYDIIYTNGLYGELDNALYYFNRNSKIIIFDEGYTNYTLNYLEAYNRMSTKHKIVRRISKVVYSREYIDKNVYCNYLFDPDLCVNKMPYPVQRLWTKSNNKVDLLMKNVSSVFDIYEHLDEYQCKFIFFEECFSNDFNNNGDLSIINEILSVIRKEDFMVKLHPRDNTNRFKDLGIKTNQTLSIPTESLVSELKDKVFITFSSGSVFNYKFICDYKIKTIVLYKLFPNHYINIPKDRREWFDKFIDKYNENFYAPTTIEELRSILREMDD